jgi:branched-subunit amino acid ABC-type transport system permease component
MLATWGLSLFLVGLTTAIFGNTTVGISAPLGSFQIGAYRTSGYTLFVIAVAAVMLAAIFAVMRWTRLLFEMVSLLIRVWNCAKSRCGTASSRLESAS